jgi:hypothetical protein
MLVVLILGPLIHAVPHTVYDLLWDAFTGSPDGSRQAVDVGGGAGPCICAL